jgi:DNA polymerase II small subunit
MRQKLLELLAKRGTLITPDAADYLLRQANPVDHLAHVIDGMQLVPLVITLQHVVEAERLAMEAATRLRLREELSALTPRTELTNGSRILGAAVKTIARSAEPASNYEDDLVVLRDITGRSTCEGNLDDFSKYFLNRFKVISGMLRQRKDLPSLVEIAKAKKLTREVSVIGMVADARVTKNGHRIVDLEDENDRISVLFPASTPLAQTPIVTDQVVGVVGTVNSKGLFVATNFIEPDIPVNHHFPRSADNVSIAFISDTHVGSKSFLDERWHNFQTWISNGDEVASSIKYVVVGGDLVDGIGVYPRQDEDLAIDDIYAQYEAFAELISELPTRLRIVMIPGNHDAVRPAEPQPALTEGVRKLFPSNVLCVGNPCLLRIHGVRILAYHGRSMDDLVSAIPSLSYSRPLDAMREMLRMRHLAPIYGGRTPIAPEAQDLLVIDEVPDIFLTGHVHGVGVSEYRGVMLINSSAWQSQTSYQKMRNLEPVPARVPIVNLSSGTVAVKEF